jgi:lipoate-protein ligase A
MPGMPITPDALRVRFEPGLDGATHMRRDAELLTSQALGDGPTLRLYTWNPPAVSLGHMQVPESLLDLGACQAAGVDVVVRPTGGRAILHWEEVTYAIVAGIDDPRFGTDLATCHAVIGRCLAAGLGALGIPAELSRPALDPHRRLLRQPCFVSPGRAELLVKGRKLLGSAQRRTSRAFLQHGSLLVGPAHERLVELLADTRANAGLAAALRDRLASDTVTLQELLGHAPSFATLAAALTHGFATVLGLAPRTLAAGDDGR